MEIYPLAVMALPVQELQPRRFNLEPGGVLNIRGMRIDAIDLRILLSISRNRGTIY
jgi:hypothetical protein